MSIEYIVINVADVDRSVRFYERFLSARVVGEVTADAAELDVVTARIRLARLTAGEPSEWIGDDQHRGFRHVGFKVARVDPLAAELESAGVSFHLRPLDAEGGVRITFFFDPDGTLLELVEGELGYHEIHDEAGVAAERALGVPDRPRFDHLGVTVASREATEAFYRPFGFRRIGSIHQAQDPRGFEIDYLKSGDSVLEIFTFAVGTTPRTPQYAAPGFAWAGLSVLGGLADALGDPGQGTVAAPGCQAYRPGGQVGASAEAGDPRIGEDGPLLARAGTAPSGGTVYADADSLTFQVVA